MVRCDEFKDWWYECDVCGRRFPIWWVTDDLWEEAGFGSQDVCKRCFEAVCSDPEYLDVDQYLEDQISFILKDFPDVSMSGLDGFNAAIRHQLSKVWGKDEETDEHLICRRSAEATRKACLVTEERKRQEKKHVELCNEHPTLVGLTERALRPIVQEKDPEIKELVIEQIADKIKDDKAKITTKEIIDLVERTKASRPMQIPEPKPIHKSQFNKTNDNIEWAPYSWNPVTGCKHGCPYCYAHDIATRFMPNFEPTFHPERLEAPKNTQLPESDAPGARNVFVCSMADLFGEWVPQEWIDRTLESCRASPDWTFLFLTKNPKRMIGIEWPSNAWVGTTVDIQERVAGAQGAFKQIGAPVRFLSCEPMQERLTFSDLSMFDWLIIGGRSANSKLPEFQPEWRWVADLMSAAEQQDLKIYMKPNLRPARLREFPGGQ